MSDLEAKRREARLRLGLNTNESTGDARRMELNARRNNGPVTEQGRTDDGPPPDQQAPSTQPQPADTTPTMAQPEVIEPTRDVEEIKRRIDGSLSTKQLSPEFKRALIEAYDDNLGVNLRQLADVMGVGLGTVWRTLQEAPATLERVRQNREAATLDDLEAALSLMAKGLREGLESGEIAPSSKNVRDFAIAYGIFADKRALAVGKPTADVRFGRSESFEDRKQRMLEVLDKAEATLQLVQGGKQ